MYSKARSKTLTKLPKLVPSPLKSPDKSQRKSVKLDEPSSKLSAVAYGIYTT